MDYIGTISRGWQITWQNKYLWILGFLAALGGGTSTLQYTFGSSDTQSADFQQLLTPANAAAITAGVMGLLCVAVIVGILLFLVSLAARGGLIAAVVQHDRKIDFGFGPAFRFGWRKVGRLALMTAVLFGIIVVLFIGLILLFALTGGAAIAANDLSGGLGGLLAGVGIVGLCLLCLLIPLSIVLSFIYPFSMRGMVLRNHGVTESIRHGWDVLKSNLGPILLLALAFLILNIVFGLLTFVILLPLGFAVVVPLNLLADTDATFLQGLIAGLGILVGLLIVAIVNALLTSWQSATFTLAYLDFTDKRIELE